MNDSISYIKEFLSSKKIDLPSLHVTLGSGLSPAIEEVEKNSPWKKVHTLDFSEVPGLTPSSVTGHKGCYNLYQKDNKTVCIQMGRLHGYEGLAPKEVVKPSLIWRLLGVPNFLLSNAAGSLHPNWPVGAGMILKDHVNFTGLNPLTGPNPKSSTGQKIGERFPDLSQCYSLELSLLLRKALEKESISVCEGVYIGVNGPNFETPAEIALFARWGMDAVGMSTVWEAIALKHASANLVGLSFLSNLGAGLDPLQKLSHAEVLKTGEKHALKIARAIFSFASLEEIKND